MSRLKRKLPSSMKLIVIAIGLANGTLTNAGPEYSSGDATVTTQDSVTLVDVTKDHATLDWNSFDIGANESVIFNQPNSGSVAINNIGGSSASKILGSIEANGHIFLVNENGFMFGENASIDTQGFLATTFNADFGENGTQVELTESGSTNAITINNLEIKKDTQYTAFYSRDIKLDGTITDNTASNTTILSTHGHDETITLPGLDIGFSASGITPIDAENAEKITISNTSSIVNSNQKGTLIINSYELNSLLNGNVNIPQQIQVENIKLFSDASIDSKAEINTSQNGIIKTLSMQSDDDITIYKSILGRELSLSLTADDQITSTDSENTYSYLGGTNGLKNLKIKSSIFNLNNNLLVSNTLDIQSVLNIEHTAVTQDTIRLKALDSININKITLTNTGANETTLDIITPNLTIGSVTGLDEDKGAYFNNIDISTDNLTLKGAVNYEFNNLSINGYDKPTEIHLDSSVKFDGKQATLDDATFNLTGDNIDITFGKPNTDRILSSLSLKNIKMADSSAAFNDFKVYVYNKDSTFNLSGELTSNTFKLTNQSADGEVTLNASNDLTISGLKTLELEKVKINATGYQVSLNASTGENSGKTANINNITASGLAISGFETLNIHGTEIKTSESSISLSADNINILNDIKISSGTGAINIANSIDARGNDVKINSGTGGFSLAGITNSKSIKIENSDLTDNATSHELAGNYKSTGKITAQNIGDVQLNGDVVFTSDGDIDLSGTHLSSNQNITIQGKNIKTDTISASNININNNDKYAETLDLYGDLIAKENLNLNATAINLMDDVILEGKINLLNEKALIDGLLTFSNDNSLVPTVNGNFDLILNATNDAAYLYDFGQGAPLSSLTLNGEGDLHMISRPVIQGASGLSILGDWKWNWTSTDPFSFTTNNQDLNLSGVSLNAAGEIKFDTGSGSLSLGEIGSDGTATELIINSAGVLNLHGDITLTGSKLGFDFSNVNSVVLHEDMTFGSLDSLVRVNFGNVGIDGTYALTIFSDDIHLGEIGSNIALQELNIYSQADLTLDNAITLVGNANIQANNININNGITSTGLDINLEALGGINMSKTSFMKADYGNISLLSTTGNIGLGRLIAKGNVVIESKAGFVFNVIDDYKSNNSTSVNITSNNLTLLGKQYIGQSVASPIVIDIQDNGTINTESDGNIYIANLANAGISTQSRVTDSASSSSTSIIDAYSLFKLASINAQIEPTYDTTLGLIDNASWQIDEEESIKTIKTPSASPNLYYSRKGWRLGY